MTTTITVTTHSWPVKVVTIDDFTSAHAGIERRSVTETTEVVPPNSEQSFHITDTRSIAFEELPAPEAAQPIVTDVERLARDEAARVAGVDDDGTETKAALDDSGEEIDPSLRA